jgi:hypothetical protein
MPKMTLYAVDFHHCGVAGGRHMFPTVVKHTVVNLFENKHRVQLSSVNYLVDTPTAYNKLHRQ